jgi:hypothetical protein
VVSLNNSPLPNLSTTSRHKPAYFDDSEIWKAFYSKNAAFIPPLFDRLDYTAPLMLERVVQLGPDSFSLPHEIIDSWSHLENALLDVADHSLATHTDASLFPTISWPRCPHECGYRRSHRSPAIVVRSATRSQDAFHSLCAVVSFVLSLWTKANGLQDAPFRAPFWGLANRNYAPLIRSWLDRFSQTHVCKITAGFRPGCFINPYTSRWGPWLVNFVRAGVQVWVVWGPGVVEMKPSFESLRSKHYEEFLPPLDLILSVRSLTQETGHLQLPSPLVPADHLTQDRMPHNPSTSSVNQVQPPFENMGTPIQHSVPSTSSIEQDPSTAPFWESESPPSTAGPPTPPPNSRQHRGETLVVFLTRLADGKKRREASETSAETQARRSREIAAAQKGYSKTCTVFQWEEMQGHYFRVKVNRVEVPDLWNDYPASRRIYHSHINEWDLCPPIPPFSEQLSEQDLADIQQYENELEAFHRNPSTLKAPSDQFAAQHSGQMDELGSLEASSQVVKMEFKIVEHLKDRYGYDVHHRPFWTPNLHDITVADVKVAKCHLLFESTAHPVILEPAIENFYNVLANQNVRVHNLTSAWDLPRLQLEIPGLTLSLGIRFNDAPLYTISSTTADKGRWLICLQDPTTVLQIYRNRWSTLDTIVRELVSRGVAFNTGVPAPCSKVVEQRYKSKGLGLRPVGYKPESHDYNAYVSARTDVLRSHLGRAALLQGGLVSRLARDTVGASDVLSGPEPSTSMTIGTVAGIKLVDDFLSDYLLDVISGVYYVESAKDAKIQQHLSWWPKDGVWHLSGFFTDEWSADAERWYQDRLRSIENGTARLYNSTEWKSNLRRYRTSTRALLTGHKRLSRSVIDLHLSYAFFCDLLQVAYELTHCLAANTSMTVIPFSRVRQVCRREYTFSSYNILV